MCLDSIVKFVSRGEVSRRFLVSFDDFLEAIVGVLNTNCDQIRVLESVIRVLSSILLENGVREKLHKLVFISNSNCLPSFISVLRNGSLEYSIACVTVLESITMNNQSKQFVAGTQDVLPVLVQLLKTENDHQDLNEAVMSFLISVSITRSIKTRLAQLGLVGALSSMLLSQNAAVSVVEKSLKVSKTATEDAVVVLWSMCCLFRDEKAQEKVARSNGVAKVLLVMQSEVGEGNVRMMCGDLIKVLRLGCKNGGGHGGMVSYETKTTHIMPC
ncbi:hypothetical protein OIU77_025716 [Salix suchowensis]|uniref:U-box domain-containing protein n=1 Tax=Salix suchowensis TaxID=1278906 RepID=A0ABQ9BX73_9ROSI|nr:hypothetical protein OIU77_025716 [Salix suchowensis]